MTSAQLKKLPPIRLSGTRPEDVFCGRAFALAGSVHKEPRCARKHLVHNNRVTRPRRRYEKRERRHDPLRSPERRVDKVAVEPADRVVGRLAASHAVLVVLIADIRNSYQAKMSGFRKKLESNRDEALDKMLVKGSVDDFLDHMDDDADTSDTIEIGQNDLRGNARESQEFFNTIRQSGIEVTEQDIEAIE